MEANGGTHIFVTIPMENRFITTLMSNAYAFDVIAVNVAIMMIVARNVVIIVLCAVRSAVVKIVVSHVANDLDNAVRLCGVDVSAVRIVSVAMRIAVSRGLVVIVVERLCLR